MRKLLIVRHAKSSWKHPGLQDHDRPLNKRGTENCVTMAERCALRDLRIDRLYSSTAVRARTTALAFLDAFQLSDDHMELHEELYLASIHTLVEFISHIPDDNEQAAIFGHNPGVTDLVNHLSDLNLANLPTGGVVELTYDADSWREVPTAIPTDVWHDIPKRV